MYYFWFSPLLSPKDRRLYKMLCGMMEATLFIIFTACFVAYPQVYLLGNNLFLLSVLIWLASCLCCDKFLLRYTLENDGSTLLADWKWEPAQRDVNTARAVFQSSACIVGIGLITGTHRSAPFDLFYVVFLMCIFAFFFLYFAHTLQALRQDGFIYKNKFYPWHFIHRYSWKQIDGFDFLVLYLEKTDNLKPVSCEEIVFKIPVDNLRAVQAILADKCVVSPQTETGYECLNVLKGSKLVLSKKGYRGRFQT